MWRTACASVSEAIQNNKISFLWITSVFTKPRNDNIFSVIANGSEAIQFLITRGFPNGTPMANPLCASLWIVNTMGWSHIVIKKAQHIFWITSVVPLPRNDNIFFVIASRTGVCPPSVKWGVAIQITSKEACKIFINNFVKWKSFWKVFFRIDTIMATWHDNHLYSIVIYSMFSPPFYSLSFFFIIQ